VSCSPGLPLEEKAPRPGPRGANCARGATDYVRAYQQLIAFYVDAPYTALGTGSFERSDTLSALPHFFEVDIRHVASQRSRRKDRFCARKSRKELTATA
jgi:pyruvate dehydrogenase complex dehydrogenase (E1) component